MSQVTAAIVAFFVGLFAGTPTPTPTIVVPTLVPTATVIPTPTSTPTPTIKPTSTPRPTPKPITGPPGTGLSRVTVATAKGNFSATVMSFDLATTRVITDTANDDDCKDNCATMPLRDFVNRNGGFAGINGTYFCPASYPDCASKKDSFDFPVYNSRLHKWINGGNLGWGGRSLLYIDGSSVQYRQDSTQYPGSPTAAIINYPGLVNDGNVQIDDNQSGLSDKQRARGSKSGIGMTDSRHVLVVVGYNVNMLEFAHVFKSLGAKGAVNLDFGGSAAVMYGGSYIIGPGRNLPNAVIFAK